jgi:Zn-finger protein
MLRRTGFKRAAIERKPVVHKPIDPKHRRAVSMGPAELVAIEKTSREENAHYRAMARDKDCQLLIPGVCSFDRSTVVLAHSNWHDKGAGRKASDFWGVWGCYACHAWLDSGKADGSVKRAMFDLAMKRMQHELEQLVQDRSTKARDRDAAVWALDRIKQQPGP